MSVKVSKWNNVGEMDDTEHPDVGSINVFGALVLDWASVELRSS